MSNNKNTSITKLELRATKVNPRVYKACIDSAKKNMRTVASEVEYQLAIAYKIKL